MRDRRLELVRRAIEARYPGTRTVVEPWSDPDGDPDIRCWLHVLDVRPDDMGPLRLFASQFALDLYRPDGKPFSLSIMGKRTSALFEARRAAETRRERARLRRGRTPGTGARNRRGTRATRATSA